MNALDRPVWSSLGTAHAGLSLGDDLARRYEPQVNRLASARDDGKASLRALARLVRPSDPVFVLQAPPIRIPPELAVLRQAKGVQMVAPARVAPPDDADGIVALSGRDAQAMPALATLTSRPFPAPHAPHGPLLRHPHRRPVGRHGRRCDVNVAVLRRASDGPARARLGVPSAARIPPP